MKILCAADIKFVDSYTITHEPISSEDLICRVAQALHGELLATFAKGSKLAIVCGKGKNAADGIALAGELMWNSDYSVRVLCCYPQQELCPEAAHFYAHVQGSPMLSVEQVDSAHLPKFDPDEIIVDCLFGTGLSRPLQGYEKQLVQLINASRCRVLAVDIPSGMMSEDNKENDKESVVCAHHTFALNAPKLAMLLPEYGNFAGQIHVLDIGLHPEAIAKVQSNFYYVTRADLEKMLKPRAKFSHKGDYGRALLIAGSHGMMGAAVLSSRACLHSGVGLLTTHVPGCGVDIMQIATPEAILSIDEDEKYFSEVTNFELGRYDAVAIGCGTGCTASVSKALHSLMQQAYATPLVLDADALSMIAKSDVLLNLLPQNAILTPHVKEFERIAGPCSNGHERLQKQQELARQLNVIVVLKGAHTSVALPNGDVYFNSTGNEGMATAGSGDVLTGVILALLAQGYEPWQAAILGVGMHGAAGDAAVACKSPMYITSSDIVEHLYALEQFAGI